jgi:hypothetical protein
MSEVKKIAKLLDNDDPKVRVAAAIVLGELRTKDPAALKGLVAMATGGEAPLQVPALDALARIGAPKALAELLPLLSGGPKDVRHAAARAIAGMGEGIVGPLRARAEIAGAEERRHLSEILAELSGKDAFSALLDSLLVQDEETARSAALQFRHRIREADAKARRAYVSQVERFLSSKPAQAAPAARAAALKILGYLEDEKAIPTLLAHATGKDQPATVRQEALVALRFALGRRFGAKEAASPAGGKKKASKKKAPAKGQDTSALAGKLLEILETAEPAVARAARDTLAGVALPARFAGRLEKLARHPDPDRARFAIERLGGLGGEGALKVLSELLAKGDRAHAELAAEAIAARPDAGPTLARALLAAKDPDRAWIIARILGPHAESLDKRTRGRLLAEATRRLSEGDRGWEAPLQVARAGDPKAAAEALRDLAEKLRKSKNPDRALTLFRLLGRSEHASADDRYVLASLELRASRRDLQPGARLRDAGLQQIRELLDDGYDVAAAMRRDRALGLEEKFYAGFHFVEAEHPLGEELLEEVLKKGGRKKIATLARNKLKLAGLA